MDLSLKTNMSSNGDDDCIVLFKSATESESEEDVYSKTFRASSFQVILIRVLDFEFVNLDKLLIKLKNPHDYEGIIFTSPRCVTGVEISTKTDISASVLEKWEKHKHFVVGERTAQLVEKLKFNADGKEAGNAKNLAEIILKGEYSKPFLYPKGSFTKDNFMLLLKENDVQVDDITIYETKPHPELETNIAKLKPYLNKRTVYFIYFSPSGVNFSLPILKKHEFNLDQIKFVAIGPTTEEALRENELKLAATSVKPDPQALLDAVLTYKKLK